MVLDSANGLQGGIDEDLVEAEVVRSTMNDELVELRERLYGDFSDLILALQSEPKMTSSVARNYLQEYLERSEYDIEVIKVLVACLNYIKEDFDRGIVQIDENANKDAYQAALKQDKTAGQSWEVVQGRLLANEAALLKKCVELSKLTGDPSGKGACLVGVYKGELAIRQRSSEIVNVIVTKDAQLRLAYHPEAKLEEGEQWAKAVEIVRAVRAAGYHVPADVPDYNKKGLVAASEAVTGADYVANPNRKEWRDAMLECPDSVADDANVHVVGFEPGRFSTYFRGVGAYFRNCNFGAVLWLRG